MNELLNLLPQPKQFTQLVQFKGIPQETAANAIGLLLFATGVTHDGPTSAEIGTLETGNTIWDETNSFVYLELKNTAESLVREFSSVQCNIQMAPGYFNLVFTCI